MKKISIVLLLACTTTIGLGQQNKRTPQKSPEVTNTIPVDLRLQGVIRELETALKTPKESGDLLQNLFFQPAQFKEIYSQTFHAEASADVMKQFDAKILAAKAELDNFRSPNLKAELVEVTERRGDGNLRAVVSKIKFITETQNYIRRLILLRYDQSYKVLMLDE
ncbi:MAG: hypothetical protein NZ108_07240 [Bacteroidia bacterium]|nr:hypothetical protein [Bacteroidia bacterium]